MALIERQRCREVTVGVDLLLQDLDLLLGGADGIGARDEAAGQLFLARERDQRLSELGRIAGLLAVLGVPERQLLLPALAVVVDGWRSA